MTITLPDAMRAELETRAKAGGFATVGEYVYAVILRGMVRQEAGTDEPPDLPPSSLTPRNRDELDAMLADGVASGGVVEADDAFWAERRRVLMERLSRKREAAS